MWRKKSDSCNLIYYDYFAYFSWLIGHVDTLNFIILHKPPSPMVQQPLERQGPPLQRLHDHIQTHHSASGLLWRSDQPDAENPTWQNTTLTTERNPRLLAGFESAIPTIEGSQTHALDDTDTRIG